MTQTIEVEPLVKEDVLARINRRIDNMAEARQMTRTEFEAWSERECYRLDISEEEAELIKAYQIDKAIQILNSQGKYKLAEKLKSIFWWIKRVRDDFKNISPAIKHLTEVCGYFKHKYNREHYYEWLLSWDGDLADLMVEKSKKYNKKSRLDM